MIKTRFAPSPTGFLHLGNARTALFSALCAYQAGGIFLLRIEDTDALRSQTHFTEKLQEDLKWLGLNWHEGPFLQTDRQAVYESYFQRLIESKLAYPCFCSEETLALQRKVQLASGQPPRYAGNCRKLDEEMIAKKRAEGILPTLRFHVGDNHWVTFKDLVKGEQRYASGDIGDFIIRRGDGSASFMFANALDDALMGVTHVLRGEDHLTNTPRQLLILKALDLPAPEYGHITLILGQDGTPLSKRNGSFSLPELQAKGFFPEAVRNYLARLGHHYADEGFLSLEALSAQFSVTSLGKSPARFNEEQLRHWQKIAVHEASTERLIAWMEPVLATLVPRAKWDDFIALVRSNVVVLEDVLNWAMRLLEGKWEVTPEIQAIFTATAPQFWPVAIETLDGASDFKAWCQALTERLGVKGKALFMPLRAALTGTTGGPELHQVFDFLGHDEMAKRLKNADCGIRNAK